MAAPRILVVEDEAIVAFDLERRLLNLGYEVLATVASGEQALKEIEASPPDLVLMDIRLEGELDGIATAAMLPPERALPVIYLTAFSEDATLARAVATQPYGYLLKPFAERELHAMIQMALAKCRAERAEREALKLRLHADKMTALSQLAAGVADDFDGLLTVIYSQLEVLGDQAVRHPSLAEPIEETFEVAIEKEKLIRRLLAFSGRQKLSPGQASVHHLVTTVTKQLRGTLGPSIHIRSDVPADLWSACVDAAQLGKALTFLAANAGEAMPDGGTLTIAARNTSFERNQIIAGAEVPAGRYILLTVTDTGAGMDDTVLERAFEPFFTTRLNGEGLGLSLVFGFVRQSGGHISIDSKIGGGTSVRLWLPVAASLPPPAADETMNSERVESLEISGAAGEPWLSRPRPSPARAETFSVPWHKNGEALFAFVTAAPADTRYHLIVEPLPRRNGWDWTVWRPEKTGEPPRHGRASSVVVAMAAAEAAAEQWVEPSRSNASPVELTR
jgi:signal transduction histidine kinase